MNWAERTGRLFGSGGRYAGEALGKGAREAWRLNEELSTYPYRKGIVPFYQGLRAGLGWEGTPEQPPQLPPSQQAILAAPPAAPVRVPQAVPQGIPPGEDPGSRFDRLYTEAMSRGRETPEVARPEGPPPAYYESEREGVPFYTNLPKEHPDAVPAGPPQGTVSFVGGAPGSDEAEEAYLRYLGNQNPRYAEDYATSQAKIAQARLLTKDPLAAQRAAAEASAYPTMLRRMYDLQDRQQAEAMLSEQEAAINSMTEEELHQEAIQTLGNYRNMPPEQQQGVRQGLKQLKLRELDQARRAVLYPRGTTGFYRSFGEDEGL